MYYVIMRHPELGRLVPIQICLWKILGKYTYAFIFDHTQINYTAEYQLLTTHSARKTYYSNHVTVITNYINTMRSLVMPYQGLPIDNKIPEWASDITLLVKQILLTIIPFVELSCSDHFYDINNHDIDDENLIFLLQNKDYIIYSGRLYFNTYICNFKTYECDIHIPRNRSFIVETKKIYILDSVCYPYDYLLSILPSFIQYDNNHFKFISYNLEHTINEGIIYLNKPVELWKTKDEYVDYISSVRNIISKYNLSIFVNNEHNALYHKIIVYHL